jgi:8-oxo-dGTP pyrophosphatase MutT (NUDIX family)
MFSCFKARKAQELPTHSEFAAAGTLFTNGSHVLAAYQKDSTNPTVSGIGGKREGSETYMETALRETVEELFGIEKVPYGLVCKLIVKLEPMKVQKIGSYVIVVYNFSDLEKITEIVKRDLKSSPLYSTFPKTISDLVLTRNRGEKSHPEVLHIAILPIVKNSILDVDFIEDVRVVLNSDDPNPNFINSR